MVTDPNAFEIIIQITDYQHNTLIMEIVGGAVVYKSSDLPSYHPYALLFGYEPTAQDVVYFHSKQARSLSSDRYSFNMLSTKTDKIKPPIWVSFVLISDSSVLHNRMGGVNLLK